MNNMFFNAYAKFIVKHKYVTILLVILTTGFLASNLMNLQIDMDQDTWIPQSHPYVQSTKVLEKVFGGRNVLIISLKPQQGNIYEPKILEKVQRIQTKIENMPEAIRHNVLSIAAKKIKDIRANEDGLIVQQIMEVVPQTPEEIQALRDRIDNNPIYINSLVSPDHSAVSIIADFKIDTSKPSYSAIKEKIDAIIEYEKDDSVSIYMAGLPVDFAWFEYHMMQMPIFFGSAILIIMLIQYLSFRSFQGMLLPIFTAKLSLLWSLGFMGLIGVNMDGMNTTTPILIMAVAAGHAIQILKRYYEEYYRLLQNNIDNHSFRELNDVAITISISRVGPVMVIAGLIASISFFTLATHEVSVIKHFGVFAGAGILSTLILEMTFIPAIRSVFPAPKYRAVTKEQRGGMIDSALKELANQLTNGRASRLLIMSLFGVVVIALGATQITVDNSLKNYSEPESLVRVHDSQINQQFGGTNTIYFLVEGNKADTLKRPEVLQGMKKLQVFLDEQQEIGKTQSIVDLIERINQAMHGDDEAYFNIPTQQETLAQYLFLYSLSGSPQDFDSFVNSDYSKAAIWVFLKTDSTNYAKSLYAKAQIIINENFPADIQVSMGGSLPQTIAGNDALTMSKFENVLQMGMVVFIFSALILRSVIGGLFVLTPLIIVVVANFGVMGWLGIPLDMGTMTTAAMAIGIGADYELYLLFRFREELAKSGDFKKATLDSLTTSGKAVIYVALSVAAGYAFLLLSGFAFYSRLAVMVISTMIFSAFGAIIFLRALTMIFKPKFIFIKESDPQLQKTVEAKV